MCSPWVLLVTRQSSLLDVSHREETRSAAVTFCHVRADRERIVVPHAGPAVLPVAAGTVLLNPLFGAPFGGLVRLRQGSSPA
ncbi:hypothetical protein [Streptomyces solincola]|uniref:hypothetical protein n=1 Tax=Streptomyces solincola TaxID=2100817 RepID=UPI0011B29AF2|nr:hypothetical protein [Streptomyces solincola]